MDSLLSNAQRCARKADSLVVYGLYDEALNQLDKSIAYLKELKSLTTRYDNVQMLNVQIDSIDRKKRSVAIKRSESIKKKNRIDSLVQNRKLTNSSTSSNSIQTNNNNNNNNYKTSNQYDLIEYTPGVDTCDENYYRKSSNVPDVSTLFVNGSKLDKDEKLIIEELSTTNAEFKKVNTFLVNEIEQLKKENDFLKVELIKLHMNDSLTSDSSISDHNHDLNSTASNTNNENSYSSTGSSNLSVCNSIRNSPSTQLPNSVLQLKCSNINSETSNDYKTPNRLLNNLNKHSSSSATSSASSSSWSISSSSTSLSSHKTSHLTKNTINTRNSRIIENKSAKIDLSRYINDDDDEYDENDFDSFVNKNHVEDTDDEFDLNNSNMLPPSEFTF